MSWQLPEGIDEIVFEKALLLEKIRRKLLDKYIANGYKLVIPPMLGFLESQYLISETLDLKTFKVVDQFTGKMMGIHADTTPQIARIDAKYSNKSDVSKFCYINPILQTTKDDFYSSRSFLQAGAEIYGLKSLTADLEIVKLMLESIAIIGYKDLVLNLGHIGIFNAIINEENLAAIKISKLRDIFQRKSLPDLENFLANNDLKINKELKELILLEGDENVIKKAKQLFKNIKSAIKAINELDDFIKIIKPLHNNLYFDLAELKTYEYHSGLIFSIYHNDFSKAIAQGGRYNKLSEEYGNYPREATGFSLDLKFLVEHLNKDLK